MADSWRRITDPVELAAVHAGGVGFVFSPFNRTVHRAGCPGAGTGASRAQPKVFAPDEQGAEAYQRARLRDHRTQPFDVPACCAAAIGRGLVVGADDATGPATPTPAARATASEEGAVVPPDRDWALRASDRAVELWTTRRLPFTTDQSAAQREMVRHVARAVAALGAGADADAERLSGLFVSDDVSG